MTHLMTHHFRSLIHSPKRKKLEEEGKKEFLEFKTGIHGPLGFGTFNFTPYCFFRPNPVFGEVLWPPDLSETFIFPLQGQGSVGLRGCPWNPDWRMSVNVNALDKILPYEVEIIKRISKKESLVVLARGLPVEKEIISRCILFGVIWGRRSIDVVES